MTRVLLVYHDENVADIEGEELRRAGYEVDRCAGPIGGETCPVLNGQRCWQVEKADVLVYDTWDTGHGQAELVEDLLDLHPDKPIVLTSRVTPASFSGVPHEEARSLPVAASRAELAGAIEWALRQPTHHRAVARGIPTESAFSGAHGW